MTLSSIESILTLMGAPHLELNGSNPFIGIKVVSNVYPNQNQTKTYSTKPPTFRHHNIR